MPPEGLRQAVMVQSCFSGRFTMVCRLEAFSVSFFVMPLPTGNNNFNIDVFIPERVVRLLLLLYRWLGAGLRGGGKSESKRRRRLGELQGKQMLGSWVSAAI